MAQLSRIEMKLASALLSEAADVFSNHGCNDFDVVEAGLTSEESDELWQTLADRDDPDLVAHKGSTIHFDWILMRFLSEKLGTMDEDQRR